jgi:hypothetical protein
MAARPLQVPVTTDRHTPRRTSPSPGFLAHLLGPDKSVGRRETVFYELCATRTVCSSDHSGAWHSDAISACIRRLIQSRPRDARPGRWEISRLRYRVARLLAVFLFLFWTRGLRGSASTSSTLSPNAATIRARMSCRPKPSSRWPRTNAASFRAERGHLAMTGAVLGVLRHGRRCYTARTRVAATCRRRRGGVRSPEPAEPGRASPACAASRSR